jgi:hypothetical protein
MFLQRIMAKTQRGVRAFARRYIDDIFIFTKLCRAQAASAEVFQRLREKGINRTVKNYSSYYGECLVAVWDVTYFRIYLYGRPFVFKTDHELLKWLMTSEKLMGMHARRASILQE